MPTAPKRTDADVIDAIATYLGTQEEWNGGDVCEFVADMIGHVRPHPGGNGDYRPEFRAATGRDVPAEYDQGDRETPEGPAIELTAEHIRLNGYTSPDELRGVQFDLALVLYVIAPSDVPPAWQYRPSATVQALRLDDVAGDDGESDQYSTLATELATGYLSDDLTADDIVEAYDYVAGLHDGL